MNLFWSWAVRILTFIMIGLSMFTSYAARPDFLTQTICVLVLYLIEVDNFEASRKRKLFRFLVFGLAVSIAYDVVYILVNKNKGAKGEDDGNQENQLIWIQTIVLYVLIGFKAVSSFVFLKVSFDFYTIFYVKETENPITKQVFNIYDSQPQPQGENGERFWTLHQL